MKLTVKIKRTFKDFIYGLLGVTYVNFLHIGKTGGTAIKHSLKKQLKVKNRYVFKLHNHDVTIFDVPENEKIIFCVRDPVDRFISAFYSRKREGRPKYNVPHNKVEKVVFSKFETPNDLAVTLSSENQENRELAFLAMGAIKHINTTYWDWFGNEQQLLKRKKDIFFIFSQNNLNNDFERFKGIVGLDRTINLPPLDSIHSHSNNLDKVYMTEIAMKNLEKWYSRDYDFIEFLSKNEFFHN